MASEKIVTESALVALASDAKRAIYDVLPDGSATGNPCTFDTDIAVPLKSLIANIVANQDLHGYDHPWVGGAGKNKLPTTATTQTINGITFTVNDDGTITVNGTATADAQITVGRANVSGGSYTFSSGVNTGSINTYYARYVARDSNGTAISIAGSLFIDVYDIETTKTLPNNVAFVDGYVGVKNGVTINNLVFKPMIRLASVSDATYEPYENICPIVGHSELNLTRCGKNLFDKTTTIDDNWINSSGSAVYFAGGFYSALIPVKPDTAYYLSNVIGGNDFVSSVHYDSDMNVIGAKNVSGSSIQSGSITTFNNSAYMRINSNTANKDTVMVSEGSTPSEYEPYNGQTYTVSFGQTVYGGVYDKSGRLTITMSQAIDLSTLNWSWQSTWEAWYSYELSSQIKGALNNDTVPNIIAEKYQTVYLNKILTRTEDNCVGCSNIESSNKLITIRNGSDSITPTGYLTIELATPIEIDVSAISVDTIVGVNNIVSDCGGDVSVQYRESVEKYVNDHSATRTDVVGTLTAGQTSITLSSTAITTSSTIEVFTDPEVPYNSLTVTSGQAVLTFDAQANNVSVKVRVT